MELVYIAGAALLLAVLIYGANSYRLRRDPERQTGEQIVAERYRTNGN